MEAGGRMESGLKRAEERWNLSVETAVNGGPKLSLWLCPEDSVGELKQTIWAQSGIPPYHQALVYAGKELGQSCEGVGLRSLGLRDGARLKLLLLTRSGPLFLPKTERRLGAEATSSSPPPGPSSVSASAAAAAPDESEEAEEEAMPSPNYYLRRAEEDRRTRARMRKLQEDMERLRLARGITSQASIVPAASAPSSSAAGRETMPAAPQRLLSAPEDTSAKESSAGETEAEEWGPRAPDDPLPRPGPEPVLPPARLTEEVRKQPSRAPRLRVASSSSEPESSGALWSETDGAQHSATDDGSQSQQPHPPLASEEEDEEEAEEEEEELGLWDSASSPPAIPRTPFQPDSTPSPSHLSALPEARRSKLTRRKATAAKATAARAPPPKPPSQRPRSKPRQVLASSSAGLGGGGGGGLPLLLAPSEEASSSADEGPRKAKASAKTANAARHRLLPHSSQSQLRCHACALRLSLPATHRCRCGAVFCARHRLPDLHACPRHHLLRAPPQPPPQSAAKHNQAQLSD